MKTIDLGKITLDIYEGPIGIRASGGADSSILLYYLALHHSGPIILYHISEEVNDFYEEVHLNRVVEKIQELTSNTNITIKNFRVHRKFIQNLMEITNVNSEKDNITMLYSGITKRPPLEDEKLFKNKITEPETDNFRDPNLLVSTLHDKTYMPFANLNKKDISDLYDRAGITNELFPLTFSCIEDLKNHCGNCWWCEERIWAFGKL